MGYLIGLFWDCKRSAEPLTYGEVEAWSRLTGQALSPDEVWCLMRLDDAHEFLDQIRSQKVWSRTLGLIREKGLDLSFETIKAAAGTVVTSLLS